MNLLTNCSLEEIKNPYVLLERWSMNDINGYLTKKEREDNLITNDSYTKVKSSERQNEENILINQSANDSEKELKNPYVLLERWSIDSIKY